MKKQQQSLADELRELILAQGSVRAFAAKAGVPQPSLVRFLGGKDLKFSTVAKVLDALEYNLCPSTSTDSP